MSEASAVPPSWRDRLRALVDRAIALAQSVAADPTRESDSRRAATTLYHVTSAVMLAWEGARIHERRGDARRMLLSRLVVDHKLNAPDAFAAQPRDAAAIADLMLAEKPVPLEQAVARLA